MDYVFPYVNNMDYYWIETYNEYCKLHNIKIDNSINCVERFQDPSELVRFHFRGIQKFMPFVDRVFFIVQSYSQVPTWLDTSKINVVLHKDFIPSKYLPTYNSNTIETFLDKIPNLNNKFIYANDDMFPTSLMSETDFFEKDIPVFTMKKRLMYRYTAYFRDLCISLYKKALSKFPNKFSTFEPTFFLSPLHLPMPLTKDIISTTKEVCPEIYKGITTFRSEDNINPYLYLFFFYFNDNYKDKALNGIYTDKSGMSITTICNTISSKKYKYVCVNDTGFTENESKYIFNSFYNILPEKSKFEKDDIKPFVLPQMDEMELRGLIKKDSNNYYYVHPNKLFSISISNNTYNVLCPSIGKRWSDNSLQNIKDCIYKEKQKVESYLDKTILSVVTSMEKYMPSEYTIDNSNIGLKKNKSNIITWRKNGDWIDIEEFEKELNVYDTLMSFINKL